MHPFLRSRLSRQTLIGLLRQEFNPSQLIRILTAALLTGVSEIIDNVALAAIIFSGDLTPYVPVGIGLSLFTAIVISLILSLGSSSPGVVGGAQDAPTAILAVMAARIAAQFSAANLTNSILPTIVVTLALTTVLTGVCCFLLGQFKLGNLIRFIPYPVVGGFLAGTGWLIVLAALSFMTSLALPGEGFRQLFQEQVLLQWLPGFGFGVLLLVLLRRYDHFLLMPGLVGGAVTLFYLALFVTHTSITEARTWGLLLQAFPSNSLWHPLPFSDLVQAQWSLILPQTGQMVAVVLITVISVLLNSTGIELAIERDLDLNRELRVAGVANLISGLGGGVVGFHALGSSILSHNKLGARSRLVGVLVAVGIATLLFSGASIISLLPKSVLGGVTLFLGLSLLGEWLYDAWFKLSKTDYFIVVVILVVIASVGFLQGIAVGLVVSTVLFVINYSQVNVTKHILSGVTCQSNIVRSLPQARLLREEGDQIYILNLQGFLFFGTANALLNRIRDRLRNSALIPLRFAILNFRLVNGLDSSAVLSFIKLKQLFQQHEIKLVFTHLSSTIHSQLQRGGCLSSDDPVCHVFSDLDHGLGWCENEILSQIPFRRGRSIPLVMQLKDLLSSRSHASALMDYLEEWDVDAGTIVFQQNQPVNALYLIEVGQVTIYFEHQPGQTHRIQTLGAGNLVGELDFFRNSTHQTSAIVDVPSTLYRLSSDRFQQMQEENSEVAADFQTAVIRILGDRLTYAYREIADLLRS
jgi:sulfate permease, SulP family